MRVEFYGPVSVVDEICPTIGQASERDEIIAQMLMQIGELAEKAGLSLRTIRHYDDEGLLMPSARSAGGFRLYSGDDLDRLLVIRRMKPLGFSIDEMRELLAVIHDLTDADLPVERRAELKVKLGSFIEEARGRREKLRLQLSMAEEFVETLDSLQRNANETSAPAPPD